MHRADARDANTPDTAMLHVNRTIGLSTSRNVTSTSSKPSRCAVWETPKASLKGIGAWKEVLLDTKQHPAFAHLPHNKAGIKNMGQEVSSAPIFEKLGFPIMIWRHEPRNWLQRPPSIDTSLDNQKATFLMIDFVSGLAPDEWQQAVGTVTVFRPDGKTDLNVLEFETVWMYADHLIDRFGEDPEVAHSCINRSYFDRWCQNYKREAIENLNPQFKELKLPL